MRVAAIAMLAPVLFLMGGASARPATNVVGGIDIQVKFAPWSVYIKEDFTGGAAACSGTILDATHVLTAAHCVLDLNGDPTSPHGFAIRAGISATYGPLAGDAEQDRSVKSVSVDPDYVWTSRSVAADDVALLTLSKPFDLTGPDVRAVALPRVGATVPVGAHVWLTGFGKQAVDIPPDGTLELINMAVTKKAGCHAFAASFVITDDAAALCAAGPTASVCEGDSGGGLVAVTRPRTLVAVLSAGSGDCRPGSPGLYTYVGAQRVRRFIANVLKHS